MDTQGQEEDRHRDQPQPRHPRLGEPHHDRGGVLGDPPTAPPSAGIILVTSHQPGSLASGQYCHMCHILCVSSTHILITWLLLLVTGCLLVTVSWLLAAHCSMSGSPGPATGLTTLQPPVTADTRGQCVAITDVTPPLIGPASNTEAGAGQWRRPALRLLPSLY